MKKNFAILLAFAWSIINWQSCKDDDKDDNVAKTRFEVRLTDAPALYDAVNIDIRAISVNSPDSENGWRELNLLKKGVYNLLEFRNGTDTLLASEDIPSGRINQIRLLLGENNTIVKDNIIYALETPSGMESGVKLNLHAELLPNITYRLWIDFDAARSIVETGSGKFILKPVIRAYTQATGGTIEGRVLPAEARALVHAILDTDTLSAYPAADGYYKLVGLKAATSWQVWFDAGEATSYQDSIITGVTVSTGVVTTISDVTLKN